MHTRTIYIIGLLVVLLACRKEVPVQQLDKTAVLSAVNTLRSTGCTCGNTWMPPVHALNWNDTLAIAAQAHARDMEVNNYFNHIAPNGSSPIQRAMQAGYTGHTVLENIAKGYTTLQAVMDAWQQSESHCRAMMDHVPVEMGMGRVN